MKLKDYIWECYDIANKNDKDVGVGRDMFIANLEKGSPVDGQDWYEGANVDYEALGKAWRALDSQEQAGQKNEYNRIVHEKMVELAEARRAGDRKAFDAVIAEA